MIAQPLSLATLSAVALLLAAPGPTNALLASAGAEARADHCRLAFLAAAATAGYLTAILVLIHAVGPAIAQTPHLGAVIRIVAAAWLAWCARRLWRGAAATRERYTIGCWQAFATTLVNPKTLVFAFSLAPDGQDGLALYAASVAALSWAVGLAWAAAGQALARQFEAHVSPAGVDRAGAAVMACFASMIAGSALA